MNPPDQTLQVLNKYLDPRIYGVLAVLAALALAGIVVPAGYMVLWSIWGTPVVGRLNSFDHYSLVWFRGVLGSNDWRLSLECSTALSFLVAVCGALLTAVFNYSKRFNSGRVAAITYGCMVALLLNPLVSYGIAMRSVGAILGTSLWLTLFCGQLIVVLPVQYFVFEAANEAVANDALWASRTCGAGHAVTFWSVFIPNIRAPLTTAFLVGFFLSFDEIVVALFVMEGPTTTVPLHLWRDLFNTVTPEAAVITTLLLCAIIPALLLESAVRKADRQLGIPFKEWLNRQVYHLLLSITSGAVVYKVPAVERLGLFEHYAVTLVSMPVTFFLIGTFEARRGIWKLLTVANPERRKLSEVPRAFAFTSVEYVIDRAEELRQGRWINLDGVALRQLVGVCFKKCTGPYIGTDGHVPSEFIKAYPDYLETQLNRGTKLVRDVRILFCEPQVILADLKQHPTTTLRFLRDHQSTGVSLFCVPRDIAMQAAIGQALDSSEFGLFSGRHGRFALFFRPGEITSVMLLPMSKELLNKLIEFFRICLDGALKPKLIDDQLTFETHTGGWERQRVLEFIEEGLLR